MHLIATYLLVFMLYAFKTSENVPSPFFEINLYSIYEKLIFKFLYSKLKICNL